MKKPLLLSLILSLALHINAQAENFNFTSYYPTPAGNYKSIHLTPQSALATNNCTLGTIYANRDDNSLPYYCGPTLGLPAFAPIAGPWTLTGNDLFLTDTTNPANKKVAIGTDTPIFKLTLANDGGILADGLASASSALPFSGAGTRLIWYPLKGAFRAGYVDGNQWDDANIGTNSMAMGYSNTASSQGASVWGGQNNSASGGASPWASVIAGGQNNTTTKELAQILGGSSNNAGGIGSRASGKNNIINGDYSTIGGGENNSTVGNYWTISGGMSNSTTSVGIAPTISGGNLNTNSSDHGTISGGSQNSAGTPYSTIAGGQSNTANGAYSVGSGGKLNVSSQDYSTVSGGYLNTASKAYATISGGTNNTASCVSGYCSISGGAGNTTSGDYSTILGGNSNTASGDHAIIPGGQNNTAAGANSLAAGKYMNVTGNHSFVWGYSNAAIAAIAASDAMIIYSGSMGIRDTTPAALLEINGNASGDDYLNLTSTPAAVVGNILTIKNSGFVGINQSAPIYPLQFGNGAYVSAAGNFINASSRGYKENINSLTSSDALDAFSKLTPVQYNYKNEPDHRYLGFIAEDVPDLVATKNRDGLSPMDIAAVLTKVVAHQQEILKEQKNQTDQLLKEFEELKNKAQIKNQSKLRLKNL